MTPKSPYRVLSALLLSGSAAASVQAAEVSCDANSLKGSYDFSASGRVIPMIETEPGKTSVYIYELRDVAVTGKITVSAADKDVKDRNKDKKGEARITLDTYTEGFPSGHTEAGGTYTLNPDCKGTLTFSQSEEPGKPPTRWSYDFELEKDGNFHFVSATGNNKLIAGRAWQINTAGTALSGK